MTVNRNNLMKIKLTSLNDTALFGIKLGTLCRPNDIICLGGELGCGKTTLTQFIAQGVGVAKEEYITSPTFGIFHQYKGKLTLNHMDLYRLTSSDDILDMGLDEYFYQGGVTVIEWYEKGIDIIPDHFLTVRLVWVDEHTRDVHLSLNSDCWRERLSKLCSIFKCSPNSFH